MGSNELHIEKLCKQWPDGSVALADVSLELAPGAMVAILGKSGAGKSTLLRCACRLIEPTSGRVRLGDLEVTRAQGSALALARSRFGFVFQQFHLVRSFTALQNVLLGRMRHTTWIRGLLGRFAPRDLEIACARLVDVGLEDKLQSPVRELSGGQQQRVAIARAFAQEPAAILADEPTASLDPKLSATVLEMLRAYGRAKNVPVVVNVHTVEHARRFADRVVGMRRGRIVHDGAASALTDADVEQIYTDPEDET